MELANNTFRSDILQAKKAGLLVLRQTDNEGLDNGIMASRECPKCKSKNTSIQAFPSPAGKFYLDDPGSARADKCWNCGKVFT